MTVQQLRKVIDEIRTAIKPENPKCLIVIYDHRILGDSKKIRHESILEINGKDFIHLSNEEKEKILSAVNVHLYLPKKEPYPGESKRLCNN